MSDDSGSRYKSPALGLKWVACVSYKKKKNLNSLRPISLKKCEVNKSA